MASVRGFRLLRSFAEETGRLRISLFSLLIVQDALETL